MTTAFEQRKRRFEDVFERLAAERGVDQDPPMREWYAGTLDDRDHARLRHGVRRLGVPARLRSDRRGSDCQAAKPAYDGLRSAFVNQGTARALVHALKYRQARVLAEPIAALMADAAIGDVPVCFLADGDTTGGNSGSPVINGRGELVGLNFDRVFEAVSGDYGWNPERSRNISVDIRFVLWVLEDVFPAPALLEELDA